MYKDDCKHRFIDQLKYKKISSKIKCTDREDYFQDNADVAHKYVKMFCDTNQIPKLSFFGSYPSPHRAMGLGKHYHLSFDPNLGHGIFLIRRIPCACVSYTSMLDQPWISGIHPTKWASY